RGEERAVTAQNDHHVAASGDFFARMSIGAREVLRGRVVVADAYLALVQPLDETWHDRGRGRCIRLGEDSRLANGGHREGSPGSLPRRESDCRLRTTKNRALALRLPRARRLPAAPLRRARCRPFRPVRVRLRTAASPAGSSSLTASGSAQRPE